MLEHYRRSTKLHEWGNTVMKPHILAQRTLARLIDSEAEKVRRLDAFLSNPANHTTPIGRRILELLEIARQRKAAHERR
jgi:hypothetical protein